MWPHGRLDQRSPTNASFRIIRLSGVKLSVDYAAALGFAVVNVFVANAADDQGLAAVGSHALTHSSR